YLFRSHLDTPARTDILGHKKSPAWAGLQGHASIVLLVEAQTKTNAVSSYVIINFGTKTERQVAWQRISESSRNSGTVCATVQVDIDLLISGLYVVVDNAIGHCYSAT
ncbi:MAG: hypothetical protein OEM83_08630, partial [Gammaproteobacteria bacterium]|nr:hypothetical protein [Gammaproteobacteria bacterium]